IQIDGTTLRLRCFPVDVHPVDDAKQGPSHLRLVPAILGLFATDAAFTLNPADLPSPRKTRDLRNPKDTTPLPNVLSHSETFYPLRVWLPPNEIGQGYLLF